MGFGGIYKVGGSTPLRLQLANRGGNFKGELIFRISMSPESQTEELFHVF
jgi:hypothetical protein